MRRLSKRKQTARTDSLQKLQHVEDVFMDPYAPFCSPPQICEKEDHVKKKNCGNNPWCLYGLGEGKDGIWKASPTCIAKLGIDPHMLVRKRDASSMKLSPPVGLKNLGATCYLNVLMQSLFHNLMIRDAVFNMKVEASGNNHAADTANASEDASEDSSRIALIVESLQVAFGHMESCIKSVYDLDNFTELLGLDTGEQQDPQEFNKLFMERLEKFQLPVHDTGLPSILKLVSGKQRYSTTCTVCGNSSGQLNDFHELDLFLQGHSSVDSALDGYLTEEHLTAANQNQYECSHCMMKTDAIRKTEIVETPEILFLQLMRYGYDKKTFEKTKSKAEVSFPNELTLNGEEYTLVAVLYHKGQSAYGGHYVTELLEWSSLNTSATGSATGTAAGAAAVAIAAEGPAGPGTSSGARSTSSSSSGGGQKEQWWFCDDDRVVPTENPGTMKNNNGGVSSSSSSSTASSSQSNPKAATAAATATAAAAAGGGQKRKNGEKNEKSSSSSNNNNTNSREPKSHVAVAAASKQQQQRGGSKEATMSADRLSDEEDDKRRSKRAKELPVAVAVGFVDEIDLKPAKKLVVAAATAAAIPTAGRGRRGGERGGGGEEVKLVIINTPAVTSSIMVVNQEDGDRDGGRVSDVEVIEVDDVGGKHADEEVAKKKRARNNNHSDSNKSHSDSRGGKGAAALSGGGGGDGGGGGGGKRVAEGQWEHWKEAEEGGVIDTTTVVSAEDGIRDDDSVVVGRRGRLPRRVTIVDEDDADDDGSAFELKPATKKRDHRGQASKEQKEQGKGENSGGRGGGGEGGVTNLRQQGKEQAAAGPGQGRGRGRPPIDKKISEDNKKNNSSKDNNSKNKKKKSGKKDSDEDSDDEDGEVEMVFGGDDDSEGDEDDDSGKKPKGAKKTRKGGKASDKKTDALKLNRSKDAYMLSYVKKSSLNESLALQRRLPSSSIESAVKSSSRSFDREMETYEKRRAVLDKQIEERKKRYEEISTIWHPEEGEDLNKRFHIIPTQWLQQWITGERKEGEKEVEKVSKEGGHGSASSSASGVVDLTNSATKPPAAAAAAYSSRNSEDSKGKSYGAGESKEEQQDDDDNDDAHHDRDRDDDTNSRVSVPSVSVFNERIVNAPYLCRHYDSNTTKCGANPRCASSVKVVSNRAFEHILRDIASHAGVSVKPAQKGYEGLAGLAIVNSNHGGGNDSGLLIDHDLNERNYLCVNCNSESNLLRSQLQSDLESNETLLLLLEEDVPIPDPAAARDSDKSNHGKNTGTATAGGGIGDAGNNLPIDLCDVVYGGDEEWVGKDNSDEWGPITVSPSRRRGRQGRDHNLSSPPRQHQPEPQQQQLFWISKAWITALKRHVEGLRRKKDKPAAATLNEPAQKKRRNASNVVDSDLSAALAASAREAGITSEDVVAANGDDGKAAKQLLDETVNGAIVCPHRKLAGSQRRRVRLTTATAWEMLLQLYPRAVALPFECMALSSSSSERSGEESNWLCKACEQGQADAASERETQRAVRADEIAEKSMLSLSAVTGTKKSQQVGGAAGNRRYPAEFDDTQNLVEPAANTSLRSKSFSLIESAWIRKWRNYINDLESPRPGTLTNSSLKCTHGHALIPHYLAGIPEYTTPASCKETAYDEGGNFPAVELITKEQFDNLVKWYGPSPSASSSSSSSLVVDAGTDTDIDIDDDEPAPPNWETTTETDEYPPGTTTTTTSKDTSAGTSISTSTTGSASASILSSSTTTPNDNKPAATPAKDSSTYGVHLVLEGGRQWQWTQQPCQICAAEAKAEVDEKRLNFHNFSFQVIIIRPGEPLPEEAGGPKVDVSSSSSAAAAAVAAAAVIDVTSEKKKEGDGDAAAVVVFLDDDQKDKEKDRGDPDTNVKKSSGSFDASLYVPGRRRSTRRAGQKNNRIRVSLSSGDSISTAKLKIFQEMVVEDPDSSLMKSSLIYKGVPMAVNQLTLRSYDVLSGVEPIYYQMAYGDGGDDGISGLFDEENGRKSEAGFKNTFLGGGGGGGRGGGSSSSSSSSSSAAAALAISRSSSSSSASSAVLVKSSSKGNNDDGNADVDDDDDDVVIEERDEPRVGNNTNHTTHEKLDVEFEVSETDIDTVIGIAADKSREEVAAAIRKCNGNLDAAVEKLLPPQ